jgi:aminomethyltransferase
MGRLGPVAAALPFMGFGPATVGGIDCLVSRSGYTGEDGFEISLPATIAEGFALRLLDHPDVAPVGLGARDSLRLEAGLSLYGHDIDATTDPVEAGLTFSIGKRRRVEGGFPGFARIRAALDHGPARLRVGLAPQGKAPVRDGALILTDDGRQVGRQAGQVTSGGFSPSLARPIAMGYVERALAQPGTSLRTELRGKAVELIVTKLPFLPHRYVHLRKDRT